jgi:hypothetical protein
MPIFYTDTGSLGRLEVTGSTAMSGSSHVLKVQGSGSAILAVSGSAGGIMEISDIGSSSDLFVVSSGSIDLFKISSTNSSQLLAVQSGSTTILSVETGSVVISGSLIVTGSITGSLLGTASFANAANINVSAGAASNNVSRLVFSNANNVSFGLNGSTITATAAAGGGVVQSYFEHIPAIQNSSTSNFGTGANLVQPFVLPYDVSIGYVRAPINFAFNQATFATTANTSIAINQSQTYYANIYSAGSGANSKSLQQVAQASVSLLYRASATQAANSNNQTVAHVFSYFTEGITTATAATTFTIANTSNFNFTTNVLSLVSGIRMIDIPFATSLPAGEY